MVVCGGMHCGVVSEGDDADEHEGVDGGFMVMWGNKPLREELLDGLKRGLARSF